MLRKIVIAFTLMLGVVMTAPVLAQETIFLPMGAMSGEVGPSALSVEGNTDADNGSTFADNEPSVEVVNSASYQGGGTVYAMTNDAAGNEIVSF